MPATTKKSFARTWQNNAKPILVAIVGGSGSGKTWLARKLRASLGRRVACLSLDDFYRDRSHLSPGRRATLNFDHPRAIDWPCLQRALNALLAGKPASVPCYDFKTHCRGRSQKTLKPRPIVLIEGLWLLRRPWLRRLFAFRIFLHCPMQTRLGRRMARDLGSRGRSRTSVYLQFRKTVEPMHRKFVAAQADYADLLLSGNWGKREVKMIAGRLATRLKARDKK